MVKCIYNYNLLYGIQLNGRNNNDDDDYDEFVYHKFSFCIFISILLFAFMFDNGKINNQFSMGIYYFTLFFVFNSFVFQFKNEK